MIRLIWKNEVNKQEDTPVAAAVVVTVDVVQTK